MEGRNRRWEAWGYQMRVEDQIVLLLKTDCFLNATQIITLAKKEKNERDVLLKKIKKHTKVDVKKSREGSWVNLQHVRILCKHLGLERQLQPLLEYAQRLLGDDVEMAVPIDQNYLSEAGVHPFIAVPAHPEPVMVRTLDFKVNVTHILKVAGQERQMQQQFQRIRRYHRGALDSVIGGSKYKGTYVGFDVAMGLCRKYGLVELESRIRRVYLNGQALRKTLPSEGIDVEVQPSDVAGQIGASFTPPYHKSGEKVSIPSQYLHPTIPIQKTTKFKGMTRVKNPRSWTHQPRSLASAQVKPLQNGKPSTHPSGLERKRLHYTSIRVIPSGKQTLRHPP